MELEVKKRNDSFLSADVARLERINCLPSSLFLGLTSGTSVLWQDNLVKTERRDAESITSSNLQNLNNTKSDEIAQYTQSKPLFSAAQRSLESESTQGVAKIFTGNSIIKVEPGTCGFDSDHFNVHSLKLIEQNDCCKSQSKVDSNPQTLACPYFLDSQGLLLNSGIKSSKLKQEEGDDDETALLEIAYKFLESEYSDSDPSTDFQIDKIKQENNQTSLEIQTKFKLENSHDDDKKKIMQSPTTIQNMSADIHFFMKGNRRKKVVWIPPRSPYNLIQEDFYHDEWKLLLATIFLNRTKGLVSVPIFHKFLTEFPNPQSILVSPLENIEKYFKTLGLRKRAKHIQKFSNDFLVKDWICPSVLHGIGKYGVDSYRMFCLAEWREVRPVDFMLQIYQNWLATNWEFLDKSKVFVSNSE